MPDAIPQAAPAGAAEIDTTRTRLFISANRVGRKNLLHLVEALCDNLDDARHELSSWRESRALLQAEADDVDNAKGEILTEIAEVAEENARLTQQRDDARRLAAALEAELARVRAAVNVGATPALIAEILDEATHG